MGIDGILNVNKPEGKTSFNVVAQLKRLTAEKHIGHAGTLDPIATGVLPVCFGQATRVTEYLANTSKTYFAQIELGISTDTFDRQGKIIKRSDPSRITLARLKEALASFSECGTVRFPSTVLYVLTRSKRHSVMTTGSN
jgi:tRNA pseudouridine55 synthase